MFNIKKINVFLYIVRARCILKGWKLCSHEMLCLNHEIIDIIMYGLGIPAFNSTVQPIIHLQFGSILPVATALQFV